MKTTKELHRILNSYAFGEINAHVHTHLCDGVADMCVANIAEKAESAGIRLVILTPHHHKQVTDNTASLYHDTDETIFLQMREEIERYEKESGKVKFLLSTETDILSIDGELSLKPNTLLEKSLDLISPTLNYHPLLPLDAVRVTHIREVDDYHTSGIFGRMAEAAGGADDILENAYRAETEAIRHSPYPAMLGHFLAAHTIPDRTHTWFGEQESQIALMREETKKLLEVCRAAESMIDLTGIHLRNGRTTEDQKRQDGFLYRYQCDLVKQCRILGIPTAPGSDAHGLGGVGESRMYAGYFEE